MTTRIVRAAHEQAAAAGDDWVGPAHVVLALLDGDSLAARVLSEAGLDHAHALKCLPHQTKPGHGAGGFATPAFYKLYGMATALALAGGHRDPLPEHWLLALAFHTELDRGPTPLHAFGLDPAETVAALRAQGVPVPPVAPPVHVPWRGNHRIVVPAAGLQAMLDRLNAEHPAGSEWRWGWNWVDDDMARAVITAEEGIDLAAYAGESASGGRPSARDASPGSPGGGRVADSPPPGAP